MFKQIGPLLLVLLTSCRVTANAPAVPSHGVAYRGGLWFDGNGFERKTMYVSDGVFSATAPAQLDSTIELSGGYVIPPFADAHQHLIDPRIAMTINAFLGAGVFYVKDQGNAPMMRRMIDHAFNKPGSLDYISANQGWTSPDGHPVEVIKRGMQMGEPMASMVRDSLDPGLVNQVDTKEDIARRWTYFVAGKPDFVKVYLFRSEIHAQLRNDPRGAGNRGIDPKLVPEIVRLAHAAGLEVSAHVFTAQDFRTALEAGVDQIAHLPGGRATNPAPFLLTEEDGRLAAKKKVKVVTTVTQHGDSATTDRLIQTQYVNNIGVLRRAKVPLLIGSDVYGGTAAGEVAALARSGLFSNLELLRMWSVETPRAIFPRRRIGALLPGYEASFLVLREDPIANFRATRDIVMRVKQGERMRLPVAAR